MASIISAGTTSATALNMSADTSGVLQLASNNGTVALTVATNQYVGIGIASPTQQLDVYGTTAKFNNASYIGYLGAGSLLVSSATASDFTLRSDNALTFGTGGPYERVKINSSGIVTMANQPSFYAYNPTNTTSGAVKIWQTTRQNVGSCYNTSTGVFTAPVAGTYQFQTFFHNATSANAQASFRLNGSDIMEMKFQFGTTPNYSTLTGSISLLLNAGDTISVFYASGTLTGTNEAFSSFSGFLQS